MTQPVLEVRNLVTHFRSVERGKTIKAVDGVSLTLYPGEIVGLIGESGCGKSTLGRSIVGLAKPNAGQIILDGVDLSTMRGSQLRKTRSAIQYVFQDPYSSLNNRQTIGEAFAEALTIAGLSHQAHAARMADLLDHVGLPSTVTTRYGRELSGGQRQRVAIARALALNPRVLIADEPVSALDLSVRAQVMNLFFDLSRDLGVACLLVAHDLALVRQAAGRNYVMYLGKIVEEGSSAQLYSRPAHPYSKALLASAPHPDPIAERARSRVPLIGEIPSPTNPPSGCRFRTRCPVAVADCALTLPPAVEVEPGHRAACLLVEA
ncbi:MAG: oligopeptide/dipeptide ABC transporter ATP-binding protein [Pseudomonadota bacterium]